MDEEGVETADDEETAGVGAEEKSNLASVHDPRASPTDLPIDSADSEPASSCILAG